MNKIIGFSNKEEEIIKQMIGNIINTIEIYEYEPEISRGYCFLKINGENYSFYIKNEENENSNITLTDEAISCFSISMQENLNESNFSIIPIEKKVKGIKIVSDYINEEFEYNIAIIFEFEDENLIISRGFFYSELYYIGKDENIIYSIDKVKDDWKQEEKRIKVLRKIKNL